MCGIEQRERAYIDWLEGLTGEVGAGLGEEKVWTACSYVKGRVEEFMRGGTSQVGAVNARTWNGGKP